MVDVSRVGWHTSVKWLLQQDDKFFEVHKVFQVMVGSPRTLQVPSVTDLAILMSRHPDITVVVHAPYVVSLCKRVNDRNYVNTLGYCIKFAKILDKIGIRYFVIHIGARSEDMLVKESVLSIWNFCQKWLMSTLECNIHLCLENDSGSKKGTKMGHINVLQLVIRKVNDPRVRMTFDVEHAYGAGYDPTDETNLRKIEDIVDVVHWNSVPQNVVFGGHLDRHSTTSFYESKISPISQYRVLYNKERPFIFEVESLIYVKHNFEWLKENTNE